MEDQGIKFEMIIYVACIYLQKNIQLSIEYMFLTFISHPKKKKNKSLAITSIMKII